MTARRPPKRRPAPAKPKSKGGRPTDYRPEICAQVIALGKEGKSRAQIAAALDKSRQTLADWEKAHPRFLDAMKRAHDAALAWWEDQGQEGIWSKPGKKSLNAAAYGLQMRNRFNHEYGRPDTVVDLNLDEVRVAFNASSIASLPPAQREAFLQSLTADELTSLEYDWPFWARPEQLAPTGAWRIWAAIAGRGWGKTKVGAEFAIAEAKSPKTRGALIGRTAADVRGTMVEGDSGILACSPPWFRPKWEPSFGDAGRLIWPNGAMAIGFSAEQPQALRGPQFHWGWLDELAAWRRMRDAWDMYRFGLRLGQSPRTCITTTPTPNALIKELIADKRAAKDGTPLVRIVRGSTYDNAANLADDFLADLKAKYEGTRLGRQELYGEILTDKPGALWTLKRIEDSRPTWPLPPMRRVVVAIDPPVSSKEGSDECGIIAAGIGEDGRGYVLGDYSERGLSPKQWAEKAIGAFVEHHADRIVAEINQGGEMVENTLRQIDPALPYRGVHASRGKVTRAEPISALYEQGRVHHVGVFKVLEDQLCDFTPDFDRTKAGYSPDRLDALVWALTELMLAPKAGQPNVRRL